VNDLTVTAFSAQLAERRISTHYDNVKLMTAIMRGCVNALHLTNNQQLKILSSDSFQQISNLLNEGI
jgi:hypothetical protein